MAFPFEVPVEGIDSMRGKTKSNRPERGEKNEEVVEVTIDSDPGMLEAAIGSGQFNIRETYMEGGKIDDVKLEEATLKLLESNIDLTVIPENVAQDVLNMIGQLEQSSEFSGRKTQFENAKNLLTEYMQKREHAKATASEHAEQMTTEKITDQSALEMAELLGMPKMAKMTLENINHARTKLEGLQAQYNITPRFRLLKRRRIAQEIEQYQALLYDFDQLKSEAKAFSRQQTVEETSDRGQSARRSVRERLAGTDDAIQKASSGRL